MLFRSNSGRKSKKAENFNEEFFNQSYDKLCKIFVSMDKLKDCYTDPLAELLKVDEYVNEPNISEKELELRQSYKKMHLRLYRNRIENGTFIKFDKTLSKQRFAEFFKSKLELYSHLPENIKEKIADMRVFALGFASSEVLDMLREFCKSLKKIIRQTINKAQKQTARLEKKLAIIYSLRHYESNKLYGISKKDEDVYLYFKDNEYIKFTKAEITEGNESMVYRYKEGEPQVEESRIYSVEIHKIKNGYEVNYIINNCDSLNRETLWYLTITCDEIIQNYGALIRLIDDLQIQKK